METVTQLHEYVRGRQDWQIESMDRFFVGGRIDAEKVRFLIGPVASRMAELEGGKLGAFYSDMIVEWLEGLPLSSVKRVGSGRIEDLIGVIYSRVQFLLPWGLYAIDGILAHEAKERRIHYADTARRLAYLVDAGVPSFDALTLVRAGFERVDASRISEAYRRSGGARAGVEILGWVASQQKERLVSIVRGIDKRRLDHDFDRILLRLKPPARS